MNQLAPLAEALGVSAAVLEVAVLFSLGVIGHLFIRWSVRRLAGVADRTGTQWDDVAVYAISPPAEWVLWIVLIYASLGVGESFAGLRAQLLQVADTGLVVLLGWFIHRLAKGVEMELLAEHHGPRDSDQRATISATTRLVRICGWVLAALMVLQTLGVSISGILAFGGIGGIAVGFAAKDVLANFLGGLSIFLDRPFAIGDWIRSPDRQIEGVVEHIGWRVTRIRTFDLRPLYVPNSMFSTIALENPSRMKNRRIFETFGIRYDDVQQMDAIVADVRSLLQQHKAIDKARTLMVNFTTCGPSSLDFFVYAFTKTTDWVKFHGIKQEVMLSILAIIESHGAEVAFPTRTLVMAEPDPKLLEQRLPPEDL